MPAFTLKRSVLLVFIVLFQLQSIAGVQSQLFELEQMPAAQAESKPLLPAESNPQHDQLLADAPDLLEEEAAYVYGCCLEIPICETAAAELLTRIPDLFYRPLFQPPLHSIALKY